MIRKASIYGDPDPVGEQFEHARAYGIDGFTVDLPVNVHRTERVELLGEIALRALA